MFIAYEPPKYTYEARFFRTAPESYVLGVNAFMAAIINIKCILSAYFDLGYIFETWIEILNEEIS